MPGEIKGYAGRFLRVDLTEGTLEDWLWDEQAYRSYLGGTGAGARVLYDEVPPDADWSDPVNRVVIASGPLGGTSVGGTGTISLVTKGALHAVLGLRRPGDPGRLRRMEVPSNQRWRS